MTDAELATRRFNRKERAGLLRDGMPIQAIRMLRQLYVAAVLKNPEALRQLREEFGITGPREDGPGYCGVCGQLTVPGANFCHGCGGRR